MRPQTRFTEKMIGTVAQCKRRFQIEYIKCMRRREPDKNLRFKAALAHALVHRDVCRFQGVQFRPMTDRITDAIPEEHREAMIEILFHHETKHDYETKPSFALDEDVAVIGHTLEYKIGGWRKLTFAVNIESLHYDKGVPLLIVRHFTSSKERGRIEYELSCRMDVLGQLWAASCLLKSPVVNIRYEVVRTKSPSTPKTLMCKTCSGAGLIQNDSDKWPKCEPCEGTGIIGMSTARCDTTYGLWVDELTNHPHLDQTATMEAAREMLDDLSQRGDVFSYDVDVEFTRDRIVTWKNETWAIIQSLEANYRNKYWPRNVYACSRNGVLCPYLKICAGKVDKDDAVFRKVDDAYPGLPDYSALKTAGENDGKNKNQKTEKDD